MRVQLARAGGVCVWQKVLRSSTLLDARSSSAAACQQRIKRSLHSIGGIGLRDEHIQRGEKAVAGRDLGVYVHAKHARQSRQACTICLIFRRQTSRRSNAKKRGLRKHEERRCRIGLRQYTSARCGASCGCIRRGSRKRSGARLR